MCSKQTQGFTLIEVMLSSFIFTVGALGLLGMLIASAEGITTAERLGTATTLARQKLNELQRVDYDWLATGEESSNIDESGDTKGDFGSGASSDGWYARSWTITVDAGGLDYKEIQVAVRWFDKMKKVSRRAIVTGGKSR